MIPPISPDDFLQGDANAPLVLIHYGDFECPYSHALASSLTEIRGEMGEKLAIVFRQFPLKFHPHAHDAALAAEIVASQTGDFWAIHDLIFAHQRALESADLENYAAQLGVSREDFRREMENSAHAAKIEASIASAKAEGAHGTPSVFLNGVFYDNKEQLWKIERLRAVLNSNA